MKLTQDEIARSTHQAMRLAGAASEQIRERQRERLATAFREWVHASALSQCNMGADECPDWPLAYELADLALRAFHTR